jgi:hypothetical protein
MKRPLILITIILSLLSPAKTQNHFQVHAGTSIPAGDFFIDSHSDVAVGVAASTKYYYRINESSFSLLFSADFFYNPLKKDYRDELTRQVGAGDTLNSNCTIDFYKYYNIPFLLGINYTLNSSDPVAFYAEAGIGVDILEMNDVYVDINQTVKKYELITFGSPAFKFGAGMILMQKYCISFDYYGLGTHKIKAATVIDGQIVVFEETGFKGSLVSITLGYKF